MYFAKEITGTFMPFIMIFYMYMGCIYLFDQFHSDICFVYLLCKSHYGYICSVNVT